MKQLLENWNKFVTEAKITVTIKAKEEGASCPAPTQDLELNTKNRDAAIHAEHIQYGPLNVDEPGDYWKDIAEYWNTTEEAAQKSLCGNCVAFDISPRMDECMPGEVSDKDGRLGYCWMHHFKCHSARSCRTWAKGGPITEDKVSYDWQERNQSSMENLQESQIKKLEDAAIKAALADKNDPKAIQALTKMSKMGKYNMAALKKKIKDAKARTNEELEATIDEKRKKKKKKKKKKGDRCTRIAKRKYDVWPSAYASGAVVKCRQGKIWKGVKEDIEKIVREEVDVFLDEKKKKKKKKAKTDYSKEKKSGLHGWFSRQGGKGKSKGWVDCNTCRTDKKTGRKTCKSCGRKEGEKRAKYPSCRPTPSACGTKGKGKKWGKRK